MPMPDTLHLVLYTLYFCALHVILCASYCILLHHALQVDRYVMPHSYDEDGGVDQSKRFEPLMARYQEEEAEEMNEFQVNQ